MAAIPQLVPFQGPPSHGSSLLVIFSEGDRPEHFHRDLIEVLKGQALGSWLVMPDFMIVRERCCKYRRNLATRWATLLCAFRVANIMQLSTPLAVAFNLKEHFEKIADGVGEQVDAMIDLPFETWDSSQVQFAEATVVFDRLHFQSMKQFVQHFRELYAERLTAKRRQGVALALLKHCSNGLSKQQTADFHMAWSRPPTPPSYADLLEEFVRNRPSRHA